MNVLRIQLATWRTAVLLLICLCSLYPVESRVVLESSPSLVFNKIGLQAAPSLQTSPGVAPDHVIQEPERYGGYFKLNRTYDAHMFFFYFEAREEPDTAPVVLWLTGGPGCSSELAVFYENGPWTLDNDLNLVETPYGWDRAAHMIYVDQPINTGFSYSDDDRDRCYDEECVSNDMLDFLQAFFAAIPELQGRDFFVTGESYAGHYVPAVASRVFHATRSGEAKPPIKLAGLAIGNGLTDPAIQYGAYADFALSVDLISQEDRDRVAMLYPACKLALQVCDGLSWAFECLLAVQFCQATQFVPILALNPGINVYDYRKQCEGPLCYDFSRMEEYLNQPEVRKALGVGDRVWEACSMSVHEDMMSDWGHSFDNVLPEILDAGLRVMIYAGDKDLICNVLGNRRWVDALSWSKSTEWPTANNVTWFVDGTKAGVVTEVGPLTFVSVKDAGHMVPMDQAKNALDMIYKFTRGKSLIPPSSDQLAGMKGHGMSVALRASRKQGLQFSK